jgi:hypothetical protein
MDTIYILTPKPHIVDCVMAELEVRRYRGLFLVWTSLLPPALKERIMPHSRTTHILRVSTSGRVSNPTQSSYYLSEARQLAEGIL